MSTRLLLMCPYLPLRHPIEFGPWWLGPLDNYAGAWGSTDFEAKARTFMQKFHDAKDRNINNPSLLARRRSGATGGQINRSEFEAVQVGIHLGVLDANPVWTADGENWRWASSDNSELYGWPINLTRGSVAVQTGGLLRTFSGGWQLDDPNFVVRSPLELHMPVPLAIDAELVGAAYRVTRDPDATPEPELARRVARTIPWLERAWRNTPSVSIQDRIVMLKTGFETLLDADRVEPSMRALRALFECLIPLGANRFNTRHFLWRASERETLQITVGLTRPRVLDVTPLQHWFGNFTFLRNQIIHGGTVGDGVYRQGSDRYHGPHFHVGERVLREALRASMALCGSTDIWKPVLTRQLDRAFAEATP